MSVVEYPSRTPDPLQRSRRSALDRLGAIKAMGLGAIGDIGSNAFGTVQTLTWSTATEWDNAVDEAGVVHEIYGDRTDDAAIELGYPTSDRGGASLQSYYPFDEDSGSTANDVVSGYDGGINGPTIGVTGLHGTTAYSFDGSDDGVDLSSNSSQFELTGGQSVTATAWVKTTTTTSSHEVIFGARDDSYTNNRLWKIEHNGTNTTGRLRFELDALDAGKGIEGGSINDGNWHHVAGVYDGATMYAYVDGTEVNSSSLSSYNDLTGLSAAGIGYDAYGDREYYPGDIEDVRYYPGRGLSASEIQALYDAGTGGYLETATKSFSTAQTPDLQNLDYDLNAGSIDLDVIGSPGTASEEVVTQTLDGSTGYTLTWSNSHTDFRVKPNVSTTNPADNSPTVRVLELTS